MRTGALLAGGGAPPFKEQVVHSHTLFELLTLGSHIQHRVLILSTAPPINISNSNSMEFSFQQF
jgi:hypothetical protein